MKKRHLLLLGSLPVAVVAILGVLAVASPSPRVTKANFDRVQEGMTLNEVRGILGKDSIIVPNGHTIIYSGTRASYEHFKRELRLINIHSWRGDDGAYAEIEFRNDVAIRRKLWSDSTETTWQKIRRVLHLG